MHRSAQLVAFPGSQSSMRRGKERNPLPVQSSSPIDKIFKSLFPIQRPSAAAIFAERKKNCTFFVFFCQNGTKTVSSFSSSSFSSAASSSYSASDPFMPSNRSSLHSRFIFIIHPPPPQQHLFATTAIITTGSNHS